MLKRVWGVEGEGGGLTLGPRIWRDLLNVIPLTLCDLGGSGASPPTSVLGNLHEKREPALVSPDVILGPPFPDNGFQKEDPPLSQGKLPNPRESILVYLIFHSFFSLINVIRRDRYRAIYISVIEKPKRIRPNPCELLDSQTINSFNKRISRNTLCIFNSCFSKRNGNFKK